MTGGSNTSGSGSAGGEGGEGASNAAQNQQAQAQTSGEAVNNAATTGEGEAAAPWSADSAISKQLASYYDGEAFDTPESIQKGYDKWVGEHNDYRDNYKKSLEGSQKLSKVIDSDPTFARLLNDVMGGKPFHQALASNYDMAQLGLKEGDEGYDDYVKSQESYRERSQKDSERLTNLEKKRGEGSKVLGEFLKTSYGDDEAKSNEFLSFADNFMVDVIDANYTPELFERIKQAFDYTPAVTSAEQRGELKGRNQNIEAKMKADMEGKGALPNLQGAGAVKDVSKKGLLGFSPRPEVRI